MIKKVLGTAFMVGFMLMFLGFVACITEQRYVLGVILFVVGTGIELFLQWFDENYEITEVEE